MTTELKKIVCSLLFIGVTFWMLDRGAGYLCDRILERIPASQGEFARMNYGMLNCRAECVILGSSRASHHYNVSMLADPLGMTVYNAGMDGRGISYSFGVFDALCQRYTPKVVILELFYHELNGELNDRINVLRPYFSKYSHIYALAEQINGSTERIKSYWKFFRYNSALLRMFDSFIRLSDSRFGFVPLEDNKLGSTLKIRQDTQNYPIDSIAFATLNTMCKLARARGIRLIGVISPELNIHQTPSPVISLFEDHGFPIFDNSNAAFFMEHPELFNDHVHLNRHGADLYTQYFLQQLRDLDSI